MAESFKEAVETYFAEAGLRAKFERARTHHQQFETIRAMYVLKLPQIVARLECNLKALIDPYFLDWIRIFSPIEEIAWNEIRGNGLSFYPQVPVLDYFVDFGNPLLRIAIEVDGAQYHDAQRDYTRDRNLLMEGWVVYRITGAECMRGLRFGDSAELIEEDDASIDEEWLYNTMEGVIHAIAVKHFGWAADENMRHLCEDCLRQHTLTDCRGRRLEYA